MLTGEHPDVLADTVARIRGVIRWQVPVVVLVTLAALGPAPCVLGGAADAAPVGAAVLRADVSDACVPRVPAGAAGSGLSRPGAARGVGGGHSGAGRARPEWRGADCARRRLAGDAGDHRRCVLVAHPRPSPARVGAAGARGRLDGRPAFFGRSIWISMAQVAQTLLAGSDVLLVGALIGPAAAVPYACTAKLIQVLANHPQMLMQAAAPALSEMRMSERRERLATTTSALTRAMLVLSGAIACVVVAAQPGLRRVVGRTRAVRRRPAHAGARCGDAGAARQHDDRLRRVLLRPRAAPLDHRRGRRLRDGCDRARARAALRAARRGDRVARRRRHSELRAEPAPARAGNRVSAPIRRSSSCAAGSFASLFCATASAALAAIPLGHGLPSSSCVLAERRWCTRSSWFPSR